MPIPREAIKAVQEAGFDVYMREPDNSWLIYTDETHIGYLQNDHATGLSISTVHIPNVHSGNGFVVVDGLSLGDLTYDKLREGFQHAPQWGRNINSVKKWHNFETFKNADSFNRAYCKVA